MCGAAYGIQNIPEHWKKGLCNSEQIMERSVMLANLALKLSQPPCKDLTLESLVQQEADPVLYK